MKMLTSQELQVSSPRRLLYLWVTAFGWGQMLMTSRDRAATTNHSTTHGRPDNAAPSTADMTALVTSVWPDMMTPQVSSRTAHWDAPRTRPTCSAVRPVRRSLWAEINTAPRESPYYEHNAWVSTSTTEGSTWYAPHLHPSQPLPRHHCDSLTRCLPMPLRPRKAFLLPQSAEVYVDAGTHQS